MNTHTPGPWEASGQFVRTARREEDMAGLFVADCGVSNPQRAANLLLIAAAPAMLEALRKLEIDAIGMRLTIIRDAIAKAEGRHNGPA